VVLLIEIVRHLYGRNLLLTSSPAQRHSLASRRSELPVLRIQYIVSITFWRFHIVVGSLLENVQSWQNAARSNEHTEVWSRILVRTTLVSQKHNHGNGCQPKSCHRGHPEQCGGRMN
jgi:hypothetical protein